MKVNKIIAGTISVCVIGMACPTVNNVYDIAVMTSSAVEGTILTLASSCSIALTGKTMRL